MKIVLKPGVRKALKKTERAARRAAQATYEQVVRTKAQTECALEQARLRARAREIQRSIDQQMQNVGELIYATYQGDPSDSDDIQRILEYTDRLHKDLMEVQKAIRGLDQEPCVEVEPKFYEVPQEAAAPEDTAEETSEEPPRDDTLEP